MIPSLVKKNWSLVTALVLAAPLLVAGQASAAPTSPDYAFERQFIYSTTAIEVPVAVTVDRNGRVYVSGNDWDPGAIDTRVRVYNSKGKLVNTWSDIPIANVGGMDVGPDGNIYVTDYSGDIADDVAPSIKVYRPNGQLVRSYGLRGTGWTAGGIVVAADGTSYVTDPVNDSIHKFAPNGTYQISFGGSGTAPGRYDTPWDVDLAPNGDLVVADSRNYRVQVVSSSNGAPVRHWGQAGGSGGQFVGEVAAVEVHAGRVHVIDWTSRVQVFTLGGKYTRTIKATTRRKGELVEDLTEVVFGPGNVMYVAGRLYPFENGVAKYHLARGTIKVTAKKLDANKTRRTASIKARCKGTSSCSGQVKVTKGKKSLGKGSYRLGRNKAGQLKVKLTPAARKALRGKPRVKVTLRLTPKSGRTVTKKVRLTR